DGASDLEASPIPVLGAVPSVPGRVLARFTPPDRAVAQREFLRLTDAVEMARAVIGPILRSTTGHALAVPSAASGDGEPAVAGPVAARLARSGCRPLLSDTDARRSSPAHKLFGLADGPGFTDLIVGRAEPAATIRPGPVPGLDVIPAGAADPRAAADLLDQ